VLRRLVTGDPHDLWHFVFAPNPASSNAARVAVGVRRVMGWRGRVVQTVASAPRDFTGVERLLFGDVVVAVSEWTRARLVGAGATAGRIRVIPPCARAPEEPHRDRVERARARYDLGTSRVVLYPGDYEVSSGAATVAESARGLLREAPDALVVFACREKTPRAAEARAALTAQLAAAGLGPRTRHVGEIDDLPALIAASSVVAFPVDDLYGKVDLPLVLLEALSLGVPLVLARGGPLETLTSAAFVEPADPAALASSLAALLADPDARAAQAARGKALYKGTFTPESVAARYDDLYQELSTGTP
jgi:phosphatidylinositol alpha-1,6-mannosyltransferase